MHWLHLFKHVSRTVTAIVALMLSLSAYADEVVIATWGGTWGKGIKEQIADPFTKETGIPVKMISGVSLANMQMISAQRNHPQVDVITLVSQDAVRAFDDGLLAPLSPADVQKLADVSISRDAKGDPMFAPIWMYPYGIIYRTDMVKWNLDNWTDLWDPRLKNKVGVSSPKYMSSYFLLMVNRIAGGNEENVNPGFQKIKKLGQNLVAVADDSATQQRLIAQGEVWAEPMISGAAYKVIEKGVPARFIIPKDGAPVGIDAMALVKNGPHSGAAKKFINFWMRPDRSKAVAEAVGVMPVPRKGEGPAQGKYALTQAQVDRLVTFNAHAINENKSKWLEQWQTEIAPMVAR